MKKVINITLGNIVFAIEHDAHDVLAAYLDQIKDNLSDSDDVQEIVSDVESAIAEKFIARNRSEKAAITAADIEDVIAEMGNPSEFKESEKGRETEPAAMQTKKRLFRDSDDVVIAGVASGLAKYFDIDPVIVRLVFVILIFFNGFGILAYIIFWLVVPKAETTADKYAMRGERVTLKEISERVKKNIENIEPLANNATKSAWFNIRDVLEKLFHVVGTMARFVVVIIRFLVGLALIIGGALALAAMVSVYSVILLSEKVFFPYDVQVALDVLTSNTLGIVAMVSSFLVMTIPLIVCIMAGSSLVAKRSHFTVQKSVTLAVVWIVAVVVAGTTSALQVERVMQKLGPVEGSFDDAEFNIEWEGGRMYSQNGEFSFESAPSASTPPERITITGTYDCIDENAAINPPSDSCMRGIRTSDGELYALNFMLMSQIPPPLNTGDTITVSGPFIPVERMSASWWHDSEVEGVLSATSLQKEE